MPILNRAQAQPYIDLYNRATAEISILITPSERRAQLFAQLTEIITPEDAIQIIRAIRNNDPTVTNIPGFNCNTSNGVIKVRWVVFYNCMQ